MSRFKKREAAQAGNVLQFSLVGLVSFSLALIGGSAFVGYKLTSVNKPRMVDAFVTNPDDKTESIRVGPWGALALRNIDLERPVEYLEEVDSHPLPEMWKFKGMNADAVKALFAQNGLSAAQIAQAFAPGGFTETAAGTEIRPSEKFLLSLDADTRGKLYAALTGRDVNLYLDYPFIFPDDLIGTIYHNSNANPDDLALFKQLVYFNGGVPRLSDYEFLMAKIPTVERRVALARAISRKNAVLARLIIEPDTDIDKIAAYWGNVPGVHFTNIRPMMDALQALPGGSTLSLAYLLPKFARERLYTYPLPPRPGDPTMDCHWTTFNFGNDTPDNRFNDPAYAVAYLKNNYYQITAPSRCGDVLLLLTDKGEIKHSAVYLADDLVFTKNGSNYRQPWILMHIPVLLASYPAAPPMRAIYMRRNVD
jgi:hypothetical protein